MLREYCDKCGKEIDRSLTDEKKRIAITLLDEGFRDMQCSFVVCRECYEKIGIKKAVRDAGINNSKNSEAVEKIMDVLRELIQERMEG